MNHPTDRIAHTTAFVTPVVEHWLAQEPCNGRKDWNVLLNNALNIFYLRLYGIRHTVKDHSDSKRGNPLPPHGLLFPINSKGSFYMHHPTDRIAHTTAFVTPVMEHWLEREIAQMMLWFTPIIWNLIKQCVLCCLCDGAYKRTLAANQKILP